MSTPRLPDQLQNTTRLALEQTIMTKLGLDLLTCSYFFEGLLEPPAQFAFDGEIAFVFTMANLLVCCVSPNACNMLPEHQHSGSTECKSQLRRGRQPSTPKQEVLVVVVERASSYSPSLEAFRNTF